MPDIVNRLVHQLATRVGIFDHRPPARIVELGRPLVPHEDLSQLARLYLEHPGAQVVRVEGLVLGSRPNDRQLGGSQLGEARKIENLVLVDHELLEVGHLAFP